jgi:hypothetical protein
LTGNVGSSAGKSGEFAGNDGNLARVVSIGAGASRGGLIGISAFSTGGVAVIAGTGGGSELRWGASAAVAGVTTVTKSIAHALRLKSTKIDIAMNKLVAGGGRMDVMLQTWHRPIRSAILMQMVDHRILRRMEQLSD